MIRFAAAVIAISSTASAADVNYAPFAPTEKLRVEVADTDHEVTRLRAGFGYFGRLDAPLARELDAVPVHLVGMRLWFRRRVGLDVAVGGNVDTAPRMYAVGARAALPIALLIEQHLTLFVAPTLAYAQATETTDGARTPNPITGLSYMPPDAQRRGLALSGGVRVGGELQLGGIGASRVALIASIGLDAHYVRGSLRAAPAPTTRDPEPRAAETSTNRFAMQTSFLTNLGVVFYF